MAALEAVIFDMDGTLLEWNDPTRSFEQFALSQFDAVHQFLVEEGFMLPSVREFSPALYAKAGPKWQEAMRTCRSFTVGDLLAEVLPEMDLAVTDKDVTACVMRFESIPEPIGPKDDAQPTLLALQERGVKLGLISNSWSTPACRNEQLERAGLLDLLPVRVYSSAMEVMKPHQAIFEYALDELGVSASQTVMVGDNLEMDIGGAQGAGMRGVWLDHRSRGLPEDATVQPDASIQHLSELLTVLDRWKES
jgi:putative hydrolase of the HAD superfamily